MKTKKITNRHMVWLLFFLCWFVYFSSYIGRKNFSAVMPQMILEGILKTSQAGTINTIFFLCYGIGQLINGLLGDRMNPSRMILFGSVTSALCNLAMGSCSSYGSMAVIWAVNGYALSMLWAPFLRLFAEMLTEKDRIKYTVNLSTSISIGNITSYLLCSLMVYISGWRMAFYSSSSVLFLSAILWPILYRRIAAHQAQYGIYEEDSESEPAAISEAVPAKKLPIKALIFSAAILLLMAASMMQGMLRDGVTSWVPSFMAEGFHTNPSFASLVTTVLPILNLLGPYLGHFVNQKLFHSEINTSAFFFLLSALALLALLFFGKSSLLLTLLFFAIVTTCIEAVNLMIISLIPLRYSHIGRTATMTGILNFLTYVGAAISTFGVGILVERWGWNFALTAWCLFALIGLLLCLICRKVQTHIPQ